MRARLAIHSTPLHFSPDFRERGYWGKVGLMLSPVGDIGIENIIKEIRGIENIIQENGAE